MLSDFYRIAISGEANFLLLLDAIANVLGAVAQEFLDEILIASNFLKAHNLAWIVYCGFFERIHVCARYVDQMIVSGCFGECLVKGVYANSFAELNMLAWNQIVFSKLASSANDPLPFSLQFLLKCLREGQLTLSEADIESSKTLIALIRNVKRNDLILDLTNLIASDIELFYKSETVDAEKLLQNFAVELSVIERCGLEIDPLKQAFIRSVIIPNKIRFMQEVASKFEKIALFEGMFHLCSDAQMKDEFICLITETIKQNLFSVSNIPHFMQTLYCAIGISELLPTETQHHFFHGILSKYLEERKHCLFDDLADYLLNYSTNDISHMRKALVISLNIYVFYILDRNS